MSDQKPTVPPANERLSTERPKAIPAGNAAPGPGTILTQKGMRAAEVQGPAGALRRFPRGASRPFAAARPAALQAPSPAMSNATCRPAAFDNFKAGLKASTSAVNAAKSIQMYGVVGEDYWSGGGITAKIVAAQLREINDSDVEILINSPGGDMFEGIAIFNLLREHKGKITVKVLGLAASAASIIAMAGDEVLMGSASFLMIHDCWVVAQGNRHDMAETAAWLEPFDLAMAGVYAEKTGKTVEEMAAYMDAGGGDGTYFGADQAIKLGLASGILPANEIVEDEAETKAGAGRSALNKAERALAGKMSRTDARALLNQIKGTHDAPLGNGTPDAAKTNDDDAWAALAGLSATLRA